MATTLHNPPYLLVFEESGTRVVRLSAAGQWSLGSGVQAEIRLVGAEIPDIAARLQVAGDEVTLCPVADAAAVLVNDGALGGPRRLIAGDAIAIGAVTLTFQRRAMRPSQCIAADLEFVSRRLGEEIDRCLRQGGAVGVLAVQLGSRRRGGGERIPAELSAQLRPADVLGWNGDAEAFVLLPDTGETAEIPARRIAAALAKLAPDVRIGVAVCPDDAHDVDGLLTGARSAAAMAEPGSHALLAACAKPLQAGAQQIAVADPAMKRLYAQVQRLAASDLPLLINGETGVGKELVAQALHAWSPRHGKPVVALNCAAISESLFESELFGHERGAFTDAKSAKMGLLESANGGTLLLDEVGECSLRVQAKLLRVLETKHVCRVGSVTERAIDVRVIAATNRDLQAEVAAGNFRQDLYFRLGVATLYVPALRDRPLDIPLLARTFLTRACLSGGRSELVLSRSALRRLALHDWPGNVRELRNTMELCARMVDGDLVLGEDLPPQVAQSAPAWMAGTREPAAKAHTGPFEPFDTRRHKAIQDEVRALERLRMQQALAATDGVRVRAAQMLQMPLRTFVTKLRDYALAGPSGPGRENAVAKDHGLDL